MEEVIELEGGWRFEELGRGGGGGGGRPGRRGGGRLKT